jgi:uncharacterized protein (DUF2252 family)
MAASPLQWMRGSVTVMARDLADLPVTRMRVQLVGDPHISTFAVFAGASRGLELDAGDFDETVPGPWEWDLKRLAASTGLAAREARGGGSDQRDAAMAAARGYRMAMADLARMSVLEAWHWAVEIPPAAVLAGDRRGRRPERAGGKGRARPGEALTPKLTEQDGDGCRRIREDPPSILRPAADDPVHARLGGIVASWRRSLGDEGRILADRFRVVDVARTPIGVTHTSTLSYLILLDGGDGDEPLFLRLQPAAPSALEPYVGGSRQRHHGQRVVSGQRLLRASPDPFLGWARASTVPQCSANRAMSPGDALAIASYLGAGDAMDRALADFAVDYADQVEHDHDALRRAVRAGRLEAEPPAG